MSDSGARAEVDVKTTPYCGFHIESSVVAVTHAGAKPLATQGGSDLAHLLQSLRSGHPGLRFHCPIRGKDRICSSATSAQLCCWQPAWQHHCPRSEERRVGEECRA